MLKGQVTVQSHNHWRANTRSHKAKHSQGHWYIREFNIYSFIFHFLVFVCLCLCLTPCICHCICLSTGCPQKKDNNFFDFRSFFVIWTCFKVGDPFGPFQTTMNFFAPNGQSKVWQRCLGSKNQSLFEMVQNVQKHFG